MRYSNDFNNLCKVYYSPLEAAIRWSGLTRHESQITKVMQQRRISDPSDFPRWPFLRLNIERIYDAIVNRDLPYGIEGVTVQDDSFVDHPNLTIRHVDLKSWMARYYPEQRPKFLFSEIERRTHPAISMDAVNVLLFERDSLRLQNEQRLEEIQTLRTENAALLKKCDALDQLAAPDAMSSQRGESTYLNIVGVMLALFLGRAPSGQFYSSFRTQESVISAMIAHHGGLMGITERTLETKFAAAKRKIAEG